MYKQFTLSSSIYNVYGHITPILFIGINVFNYDHERSIVFGVRVHVHPRVRHMDGYVRKPSDCKAVDCVFNADDAVGLLLFGHCVYYS